LPISLPLRSGYMVMAQPISGVWTYSCGSVSVVYILGPYYFESLYPAEVQHLQLEMASTRLFTSIVHITSGSSPPSWLAVPGMRYAISYLGPVAIVRRCSPISRDSRKTIPKKQHRPRKRYGKRHQHQHTLSLRKYTNNKRKNSRATTTEGCRKANGADMQVFWQEFCGHNYNRREQRTQKEPLQGYRDSTSVEVRNEV
jgi:hypothetical protein